MKGKCGPGTILAFHLLMASVYAHGGIKHGDLLVPVPEDLNLLPDSSNPLGSLGKGFISDGVLWNLSPEGESSSPSEVIPPKVNCIQEGIFPVIGSCHDYYYCQDLASIGLEDWNVFWFTCKEGSIFDVDSQKCLHPSLITGHPECQQKKEQPRRQIVDFDDDDLILEDSNEQDAGTNTQSARAFPVSRDFLEQELDDDGGVGFSGSIQILNRKKRSVATVAESGEKVVDIIAKSASEACHDVKNIDNYVRQINAKHSLEIPPNIDEFYTQIMKQYNDNLRIAQQNTGSWKEENGILAAIKETFLLTKEFEPKFSERFQRMKNRVATVLESDEHRIKELEEELIVIKNMITKTEQTLQKTVNMKVNEFILRKVQEILTAQKADYRRLIKEYNEARKEAEFEELTEILEYVKSNSIEIREKVEDTRIKIEDFQGNIQTDSGNFNRVRQLAGKGKQLLQEKRDENRNKMAQASTERANLRSRIERERSRISTRNRQLQVSREDLRQEKRRLEKEAKAAKDKQIIGGVLMIFNPVIGGVLLGVGTAERSNAYHKKEAAVKRYEEDLRRHDRQVTRLNNEIQSANNRIAGLEAESQTLQRELPILESIDDGLQNLQNDVTSILPFLRKAIASLERMKEVFLETERDLDKVIGDARKAHTSAQKRLVSYFMYYAVDEKIKKNWENAKDKIISVGECVTTK